MNIILIGAELEENLGLNYMASALESKGHRVNVIAFNSERDIPGVLGQETDFNAEIIGLSMVFTGRAKEFCRLAQALRDNGFKGHLIAGGHFASFNCQRLLEDHPAFDSVGLGEGEELICELVNHLDDVSKVQGLCYREANGKIVTNPSSGRVDDLDKLPFPRRTSFHDFFAKPIASILSSRGCWRNCAFCSINAWYKRVGGKNFRFRSIENIIAEMKKLYFDHGIRIFNFQDDNFFLYKPLAAKERFKALVEKLHQEGIEEIAIAVKARPDSITYESVAELDKIGLFRVFLGVENASEIGLNHLNRKCTVDAILNSLKILNDFNVHIAYNLLMFEPDTTMEDILVNLHFMERHIDNPFNFCRAEAYEGTGLAFKLRKEGRLLGDYFGFDYRLKDPYSETFHQIANHAFFDRNFSNHGLHYFNMQVDFCYQVLRRFYPGLLTQSLRGAVKNFIKQTNLDTYQYLCTIYDFVKTVNPGDGLKIMSFARDLRQKVDQSSWDLHLQGKKILDWMDDIFNNRSREETLFNQGSPQKTVRLKEGDLKMPGSLNEPLAIEAANKFNKIDLFGLLPGPIPYNEFKMQMEKNK
ncbi:MAG: B12-binding domain-containing radical SAM protein [Acidobacteria bacterium]|jgi:radical SAM superfamily enzyme YgiQ (UPF0313 family)|nr:B12-binding domain-containing radical SAM protein [Acidobacteriota bacterium]